MNIVFLGMVTSPNNLAKSAASSVAGNKMQYHLLNYLSQYEDIDIKIVSYIPHQAFPGDRIIIVKSGKHTLFQNTPIWEVSYINLPIIKNIIVPIKVLLQARKLVDKNTILMSYDLYPNQGLAMRFLRKKVRNRTVCILADLSIGGVTKTSIAKRLLRKAYDKSTLNSMKKCKYYITLNEYAIKTYAPSSKFIVINGGIEPNEFSDTYNLWNNERKNIVYTGALVEYSGILNLIKSLKYLDNNEICLDIYGDGPLREEILKIASENSRINYFGTVTNEEAILIQKKAWLLANPRPTESTIAKVTFPSKIFEYMMSGRPVISTMLNGFNDDFKELIFWAENSDPIALALKINEINGYSNRELTQVALNARNYLLNNKTWGVNASMIHEFLKDTVIQEGAER